MAAYEDGWWWSNDGLRLHYRDYPGPAELPPLICLHGLTRNARDFAGLADALGGRRRVIAVDLRGRGESAYAKDPLSYVPLTYLQDIEALLTVLALERFVVAGTSLGGLVAMLLAPAESERLAGVVLNDIGPVIEPAGLARIRGYVGKGGTFPTWLHAARAAKEVNGAAHPDYALGDWIAMAKRLCRVTRAGRIVWDYDTRIAEPFRLPGSQAGVDLWPAFVALAGVPTLLVRGEHSDILTTAGADEMARRLPGLEVCTVAGVGHAPTLTEPDALAAVERLLARS